MKKRQDDSTQRRKGAEEIEMCVQSRFTAAHSSFDAQPPKSLRLRVSASRTAQNVSFNQGLQVENPNADSITDIHFIGMRKQIRKVEVLANGGKQIDWTVTRQQIEMTARSKVASGRPQAPLRLNSEDGVNVAQKMHQAVDVRWLTGIDQIDITTSLLSCIQLANRQNVVDPFFKKLKALQRRERKHPADDSQVHAVFAVFGKWSAIIGV